MRVRPFSASAFIFVIALLTLPLCSTGQDKPNPIDWQNGPTVGRLGDIAQIAVPQGYRFTDKAGAQKLLELTQNPTDGNELGALIPDTQNNSDIWFVVFEFDDSGYVRDTERNNLDAKALLDSIRQATEDSNKTRQEKGWPAFHVVGWSREPYYDLQTHNLTWAILGSSDSSGKSADASVNYSVRLLGRSGFMKADLVLSPDQVDRTLPQFQKILAGFSFLPGKTYADWRSGDKVAKYGLAALVVGGAAAAAANSGLLLKFWKLIVAAFFAFVAFLKRIYRYLKRVLSGKAAEEETPQHG